MTLKIVVPRRPVSVNATYANNWKNGQKGRYMTSAAKDFRESLRAHAIVAKMNSPWPMPDRVRAVNLHIVAFNTKHDADGPIKLIADSLEGIVYANDRCVQKVTAGKGTDSTKKPRVEIDVELVEVA